MTTSPPSSSSANTTPQRTESGTILFIDDDRIILEMVGNRLEFEGYKVSTASRAEDALERLNTLRPDLIILDIAMPGLGGLGFLRSLNEVTSGPPCPIVVFSGRHELASFFDQTAVAAFIPKTCNPEIFMQKIHEIVTHFRHTSKEVATNHANQRTNHTHQRRKLLLIEDDMHVRHHLANLFTEKGFDVCDIENGRTLLEVASSNNPHIILIKYMLPHHNGPTLAEQLGEHPPTSHIPVVLYDETGLHSRTQHFPNVRTVVATLEDAVLLRVVLDTIAATSFLA